MELQRKCAPIRALNMPTFLFKNCSQFWVWLCFLALNDHLKVVPLEIFKENQFDISYLWINIAVEKGTESWLGQIIAWAERPVNIVELGKKSIGNCAQHWHDPDQDNDSHCSLESGHCMRIQRVTNCQVPLHGKSHYDQHRRVGGPANIVSVIFGTKNNSKSLTNRSSDDGGLKEKFMTVPLPKNTCYKQVKRVLFSP